MLPRSHFTRVIGAVIIGGVIAAGVFHAATGGGGGTNWAGAFSCYGNGSSCWTANPCTTTISSGLSAAISAAAAGDTICLNAGTYSLTSNLISGVTKSSDVTIQPTTTSTAVTINNFEIDSSSHLKFQGESIAGANLGQYSGSPGGPSVGTNITFSHINWTGPVNITHHGGDPAAHLTIDGSSFNNLGPGIHDGRLQLEGDDPSGTEGPQQDLTIVISNNIFENTSGSHPSGTAPGNCSDGINSSTNAPGITVGPGNEFTQLQENDCSSGGASPPNYHVDPIQLFGTDGAWHIYDNYFHDNGDGSGGLEDFDGNGPGTLVNNNVFNCGTCSGSPQIVNSGDNWTWSHNTIVGGYLFKVDTNNSQTPSGATVKDTVIGTGVGLDLLATGNSYDHNLNCGCTGTGNISGTEAFVSSPASGYYHYQLASSSPGYHAGNSGLSMGIDPAG